MEDIHRLDQNGRKAVPRRSLLGYLASAGVALGLGSGASAAEVKAPGQSSRPFPPNSQSYRDCGTIGRGAVRARIAAAGMPIMFRSSLARPPPFSKRQVQARSPTYGSRLTPTNPIT